MKLKNKQIAIVGGGPGGLMLARLLQINGVNAKVYERDLNRDVRVQGATLDLHQESGLKAMRAAGLMETFTHTYRPGADRIRLVDEHAHIFFDEHLEEKAEDLDSPYARPEIDRGPLRKMLLDALEPGTVVWDSQFVTLSPIDDQWKLEFKNGATAVADMVIGADGAHSKIRPFVTKAKPIYAGVTIIQGNIHHSETAVPNMHRMLQGAKILAFGGNKYLHVSAKGDGSLQFYASFMVEEHGIRDSGIDFNDREQVIRWFKETYKEWDAAWLELIENADLPLMPRPQYLMPLDEDWETLPNLTLLGDAAHIMPPSGEGVNLAMLDALELTEYLTGDEFADTRAAIKAYEAQSRARARLEAHESMNMVTWMHGTDALERILGVIRPV